MDSLARGLRARGIRVLDGAARADLVVVNTCTVTAVADAKSRQAVRRARRANPDAEIVVTGCSVAIDPQPFAEADPAAHLVDARSTMLDDTLEGLIGAGPLPTLSGVESAEAHGALRPERTRAYIKVQDGCSFHCTYCVIPRARGAERSLSPEAVLADV